MFLVVLAVVQGPSKKEGKQNNKHHSTDLIHILGHIDPIEHTGLEHSRRAQVQSGGGGGGGAGGAGALHHRLVVVVSGVEVMWC